ncbi:MAG: DUF4097 family beta strand repeat protein, partial [Anaerolineales bacterium]|nr:DUF4097 family beta strand repeat protein [Anaerolineales bacterium]
DAISVTAVKHLNSGNADRTEVAIHQWDDGVVVVETRHDKNNGFLSLFKPCKVEYTVTVPKNCSVDLNCVSSKAAIQGLEGKFKFNTVSGALEFGDITGLVKVVSVSGVIKGQNLSGSLEGGSVSGKIRVMESQIPEIEISTVSGNIIVQTPILDGSYIFKGVSGNVTLIVPEDTGCVARTKSVSGRLQTSLPITKDRRYGPRGLAEIQGGGPEVVYKSVSGSLKILTSEDDKPQTIHVASPVGVRHPRKAARMDVLEEIERGELSVDDALEKLNS